MIRKSLGDKAAADVVGGNALSLSTLCLERSIQISMRQQHEVLQEDATIYCYVLYCTCTMSTLHSKVRCS